MRWCSTSSSDPTHTVSKRLRELGIRIALGAQRKEVLQAALGRAVKLLAVGSAAGLFLGVLATKVLAFIVYQANPHDRLAWFWRWRCWAGGYVDSSISRVVGRSVDPASRRVRQSRPRRYPGILNEESSDVPEISFCMGDHNRDSRARSATNRLRAAGSRNIWSSAVGAWLAIACMRTGRL